MNMTIDEYKKNVPTTLPIEEYKKIIGDEFHFSECYDKDESLIRSFNAGTILLTPCPKQKQRLWLKKAFDEWNRGGRTIVLITPYRISCKYFKEYLTNNAEIRFIRTSLTYGIDIKLTRLMILSVFKAKPLRELNHLVTFN